MGRAEALALPIKTFWLMSGNIDRIQAQKDMRSLTLAAGGQSGEAATQIRQQLVIEAGTIVKMDVPPAQLYEERDEEGFSQLKELSKLL